MTQNKLNRRDFIKLSAVGVVATAGTRLVQEVSASTSAKGEHQWAKVIDQSKCTGCNQCRMTCNANNDVNPEMSWTKVLNVGEINGKQVFLPRPCMHCEHAPCAVQGFLPVGFLAGDDGSVIMAFGTSQVGGRHGSAGFALWTSRTRGTFSTPEDRERRMLQRRLQQQPRRPRKRAFY